MTSMNRPPSSLARISSTIRDGIAELGQQPRIFFTLCTLAAMMMFTYGLVRPPAKSMFTDVHGASALPVAWLAVAALTISAAWLYGRLVRTMSTPRLFFAATIVLALLFTALRIAIGARVPYSVFALYVLMETYIVVLVESFWSIANLRYQLKTARVAYGLFLVCGSLGSMAAELLQPTLAHAIGTAQILWFVGPILIVCGAWCSQLKPVRSVEPAAPTPTSPAQPAVSRRRGWEIVLQSRYLWLLVLIVASAQILINLADYMLTASFQETYAGEALRDARTAAFGTIYATINFAAIALQLVTAPLIGAFGVMRIFIAIPALVGLAMVGASAMPRAIVTSIAFVTAKVFDYSLFRATKEMLYLPLEATAKTVGKSIVDMGTYRAAKAGASLSLLVLVPLGTSVVAGVGVALAVVWLVCAIAVAPRYRAELEDP
jgi:ATP:ADP antiporter, AAA family